jgi:hypothetical protein
METPKIERDNASPVCPPAPKKQHVPSRPKGNLAPKKLFDSPEECDMLRELFTVNTPSPR